VLCQLSYVPEIATVRIASVPRFSRGATCAILEGMSAPGDLTIDRAAAVDRMELDAGSWVELVTGFVRDADDRMAELHRDVDWQQTEVLRYDHYVPEKRLSAALRSTNHPLLRQTELHLASRWRVPWDGVGALLYRDGDDWQGFHGDRSLKWLDDTLIAIVVLGERRPFAFRPRATSSQLDKRPAGEHPDDVVLMPGHGDLIIMGGANQRDWLHTVPKADTAAPRISLTWRWTSRRGRPDTNPSYYDGRSFSDGTRQPGSRTRP
jgi:alkylated DNA repair dioxygenase AlkB